MGKGEEIGDRLFRHHTKVSGGDTGEPAKAEDLITRKGGVDPDQVTERLYTTQILMGTIDPDKEAPRAEDTITKNKDVSTTQLSDIVDRLNTTFPECQQDKKAPEICTNSISRKPATDDEIKEIYDKLHKAHTLSSGGGPPRHKPEAPTAPGYGQKCFPVIEGIETRFKAEKPVVKDTYDEQVTKFVKTQTCSSQARLDNPRILLYPERTTLMNNVERIKQYQDTGATVRQKEMQRREKWFN